MHNWLRRVFSPPIFGNDSETRTARTLNNVIWVSLVGVLFISLSHIVADNGLSGSARFTLPGILIILIFSLVLLRNGFVRTAGLIVITGIWVTLTYEIYSANGLRDVSILAYFILALLSTLFMGWKIGVVVGVLCLTVIWHLTYLELSGLKIFSIASPVNYARDLTAIFIISVSVFYLIVQRLNQTLLESRLELRERLRADDKMNTQAQYLAALHDTALGLINRLELSPLLELILSRASELLDTPHVGIDLISLEDNVLIQEYGIGVFANWNGEFTSKGVGVTGKVWDQGKTLLVQDYDYYPTPDPKVLNYRLGSVMGTPLRSQENVIGTLLVAHTDKTKTFTPEQAALLERFAALASVAIDNARLYEKAQTEIIERKIIEQELRSSESRFRKVFENNKIAIVIVTLDKGVFLEANEAFWKLSQLMPEKALGRPVTDFSLWADPTEREVFIRNLLEKGSLQDVEVDFPGDAEGIQTALGYYEIINVRDLQCILCMFYDITEQKQAQNALKNAESRTRAIIASIPDLIFEVSNNGIFLDFLASSELVPIMQPHEFIGRNMYDLFPPQIAGQAMFAIERAIGTSQAQAFEYGLPPEEEIQFFEARVTPVTDKTAIVMIRDISQRKWVETEREKLIQELEEKNAESEALRDGLSIIVETLDETRTVSLILEQLEKVIPYDSASVQLLNEDILEIVSVRGFQLPENHIGLKFRINESEPSYPLLMGTVPYILEDNAQKSLIAFQNDTKDKNIHSWMAIPLKVKGKIFGIIVLDGHTIGQFTQKDVNLALTYADQVAIALENARLFSEVQAELTERKRLIEELESKNAELERFTYTVSHDLKSPVITIRGFLGFLEQDVMNGNQARLRSDIKRISDATEKMQSLLNDLLELSRLGRLVNPSSVVPFNEIVQEAIEIVHGRIQKVMAQVSIQPDMSPVYVDRPRMVEALQNLIDNAAKFSGENPRIEIGQAGEENEMPIFYVRDNGVGIAPQHQERVFGLFNKLDADTEGTGVGLALVKRTIEVHKGRIWVESEPEKGSTFYFTLPAPLAEPNSES